LGTFDQDRGDNLMATTTKKDLIDRIAEETNQKRTVVKTTVQSFLDNVIAELSKGNRLEFRDFGVFEIRDRAPRMAQNPRTLERVPVPAKKTVKFKVGRLMRDALEDKDSQESTKAEATVEVTPMSSVNAG
jgi:integration host factor subunit beta